MLITKFNKMIKSKFVLIALAFIIVLAFVGLPVASQLMNKGSKPGVEGELFGSDISSGEFRMARYFELRFRNDLSLTPEENEYVRNRVWKRLAALKYADKIGIRTSDDEIAAFLQKDPAFANNAGQFSRPKFKDILSRMNISENNYEEYMRQELILRKLQDAIASTIWVPHSESKARAASLTDEFVAEYVRIGADDLNKKIVVDDETAMKYFADNKNYFMTERSINVRYIEFHSSDYLSRIKITDKMIEDYYYANIDDYSQTDTNDIPIPVPLDEVKGQIISDLKLKEGLNEAAVEAFELVETMSPMRHRDGKSMEEAAKQFDAVIKTSGFFTVSQEIPGIDADSDFNRIAFSLNPDDEDRYFSDAIIGTSNVYVIAPLSIIEPYIPEFSEVKDQVIPLAKEELLVKQLYEKAKQAHDYFEKQLTTDATFQEIADKLKLQPVKTDPFNAYQGMSTNNQDYAEYLIPAVLQLDEGSLSDVIDVDDALLIAYVSSRTPADPMTIQAMKPQVSTMIERYRGALVYEDWLKANLDSADYTDYMTENMKKIQSMNTDEEPDEPSDSSLTGETL